VIQFWIRADLEEAAFRGDELRQLAAAALAVLQKENLLRRGDDLRMVECDACGSPHIEEVDIITDSPDCIPRAYIPCEETGRRVSVPLDRFQVWAINFERLGRLVAVALGISGRAIQLVEDRVWMLGTGRFLDRTRDVFLVRGIGWADSGSLLENNSRFATSPCPLILCMNRVPENPAWFSAERVVLSLAEFDWLEGDQSRLLNKVNDILMEHPRPLDQAQRVFRKEGDFWSITFEGKTVRIKDGKGARYLSYLINEAEREFRASELVRAVSGKLEATVRGSAGEVLDDRAMADYRSRAESLQTEIEQARKFNDTGRVELLQNEMKTLAGQITSATGLGGRRRSVGDSLDRARKAVSMAIVRTIAQIQKADPALGDHLDKHVARGAFLFYRGDGIPWNS
jgi:hypothetical protein